MCTRFLAPASKSSWIVAATAPSAHGGVERLCVHRAGTLVLGSSPTRAALLVLVSRACLV